MTTIPAAELEDLAAAALRASGLPAEGSAAVARVDGRNGIGPLVGMHALRAATAGARSAGIGAAFARGSNHFGPVMPDLFLAAQDGLAAFVASNATTTIAPWGGREARLGNNPLGLGVPNPAATRSSSTWRSASARARRC